MQLRMIFYNPDPVHALCSTSVDIYMFLFLLRHNFSWVQES